MKYYFYDVFGRSVFYQFQPVSRLVCSRVFWLYRCLYRLASITELTSFHGIEVVTGPLVSLRRHHKQPGPRQQKPSPRANKAE